MTYEVVHLNDEPPHFSSANFSDQFLQVLSIEKLRDFLRKVPENFGHSL